MLMQTNCCGISFLCILAQFSAQGLSLKPLTPPGYRPSKKGWRAEAQLIRYLQCRQPRDQRQEGQLWRGEHEGVIDLRTPSGSRVSEVMDLAERNSSNKCWTWTLGQKVFPWPHYYETRRMWVGCCILSKSLKLFFSDQEWAQDISKTLDFISKLCLLFLVFLNHSFNCKISW